jgi:hypothetical protein
MNVITEPNKESELPSVFREIKNADMPTEEKLAKAFEWMTHRALDFSEKEIELARAMKDDEGLIKVQIKHEMLKTSREMFQDCYRAILGRKAWDE